MLAIDLLRKFLIFNPKTRITIDEALNHPFLAILNSEQQEVYYSIEIILQPITAPVDPLEFEFENYPLTLEQIKGLLNWNCSLILLDCIYEEILLYHFPEVSQKYIEDKKNKVLSIQHILQNDNAQIVFLLNINDFED